MHVSEEEVVILLHILIRGSVNTLVFDFECVCVCACVPVSVFVRKQHTVMLSYLPVYECSSCDTFLKNDPRGV